MTTQTQPPPSAPTERDPSFRRRVFTPVVVPLTVIGGIVLFAMSFSRILLAVPETISTVLAIGLAAYVLLIAGLVAARDQISPRALAVGLVLGFVGVVGGGAIAAAAGPRDFHHEEEEAAGEAAPGAAEIPPDALVFVADQTLMFLEAPTTATAGTVTVALDNPSGLVHTVVFEGVNSDQPVVEGSDTVDVGEVELPAGEVVYYCDVAGHREAGMEGTLTVS